MIRRQFLYNIFWERATGQGIKSWIYRLDETLKNIILVCKTALCLFSKIAMNGWAFISVDF